MRILELSLRNYRVFEEVDLELPARVIGIFGPNGSGKTSIVESIGFALYGVDAARTKKHGIRTQGVLTDCEVRLVFEHGGHPYEVRRSLKGKGSMPEAELYGGDLLLAAGVTDVDAEIRRLLHMDLHVFRASVFAEQKQVDAFSEVGAAKRKEMALRLLGIKPVDEARSQAKREARLANQHVGDLAEAVADIAALEAELKGAKEIAVEAEALAKAAASELKAAVAVEKRARTAFDRLDAARERIEKLTIELQGKTEQRDELLIRRDRLAERVEQLTAELAELPVLEAELSELAGAAERLHAGRRLLESAEELRALTEELEGAPEPDAQAAGAALEAARADHAAAQAAAAEATAKLTHERDLLAQAEERLARAAEADPSQPCPTCGRPLGKDFAGYLKHCRQELTAAKARLKEADRAGKAAGSALAKVERAARAAEAAATRAQEASMRRDQLAGRAEELERTVAQLLEPFDGVLPDPQALLRDAERARELEKVLAGLGAQRPHLGQAEKELGAVERSLAAAERQLEDLTGQAERVAFDPDAYERAEDERDRAERALEEARAEERDAADGAKETEKLVARLDGELKQARETSAKVDELRSDARHVARVAGLLDGFRDHLVQRIGPELSREAEALFRELTNREYDDLRIDDETLTIEIADGDTYHPIERFSGSESDLANLALRVAISMHLSRVSGADIGMLVLDEVLASLDEERKDLMVQTLGRLASRFHQLFVITHAERVKDQFPATIEVAKVGRRRSVAALI